MSAISIVEKVLSSELLNSNLILVPDSAVLSEEIEKEESLLNRTFSLQHKKFLQRWNGIDLEVIRLYCCGNQKERLRRLADEQISSLNQSFLVIGSDSSGFVYLERNTDFQIFVFDTQSDEIKYLADNFDDLFEKVVFGEEAKEFLGEDWFNELRFNGVF